jgi:hypothetical protein
MIKLPTQLLVARRQVMLPALHPSIPKSPRTNRPVGYAFVDLSTGKEILKRKVSVQLAGKLWPAGEKAEGIASGDEAGGEGNRRRGHGDRTVSCSYLYRESYQTDQGSRPLMRSLWLPISRMIFNGEKC